MPGSQHLPLPSLMSVSLRHLLRGGISRGNVIPIPALKGCSKKSTLTLNLKDLVLVRKRPGSKWKANRMNTKGDNVKSVLPLALCRAWFTSLLQQRQMWGPAPLRHAPTLRGSQNTAQRESLGHQMAQCRSNVPPRRASIYRYGHYVTRAYLLKEVTVKEKK